MEIDARLGVGAVEEVTFIERSLEAFTYRDGVRFANGREILLQQLTCGQRAEVLSLGGEEEPQPPRHSRRLTASSSGDASYHRVPTRRRGLAILLG